MNGSVTSNLLEISRLSGAMLLALLLLACDGSTGPQGPAGAPGATGPAGPPGASSPPPVVTINDIIEDDVPINAEITSVTLNSPPVVAFTLTNKDGLGVVGLSGNAVSGVIAKLIPGADGTPNSWQNYVNREEGPDGSTAPGSEVLTSAIQGDRDRGGTLLDNNDGTYVYTFSVDPTNVSSPLPVSYDPALTHRIALQIQAGNSRTYPRNPTYTFRPADGATSGILTRDVVSIDTCNGCHNRLAFHGGGRLDTKYCVTCHNPGSIDQDSGNTLDFKVMIHKIHAGIDGYQIYGFRERLHDYSNVVWTQDIRNCTTCHDVTAAPDAENYRNVPSREACGSCHNDVNFATGEGHSDANFIAENSECSVCHSDSGFVGSIADSHEILADTAALAYQFNILGVTNTGPGDFPQITFSVTDPTNGNAPYDLNEPDGPFTQGGGASRLAVDLAWNTIDYTNIGNGGSAPASVVSLNPLFGGATDNGDGSYTITSDVPIPLAGVTGSGGVGLEGHPAADLDGDGTVSRAERIPVTSAVDYFAITDASPVARREVVAIEKCEACHKNVSLHGSNRNNETQLCVMCHNPNNTDIARRPADPAATPDGKREESVDFKRMIHQIHAGKVVVYGFGGSVHDFRDVVFPGKLTACDTCHIDDSYYPVDSSRVLATTIDTGANRSDPFDDINITPNASACSSCHTGDLEKAHMEQNGGAFDAMQLPDGTLNSPTRGNGLVETCALCHGPGAIADVKVAHDAAD